MALISKSFPRSTRPSLQTLRHSPAPADKSRKARAKTPLMRPSLQTAPRTAVACVAAVAPKDDCSRSTGDARADTRANSRDGVEPTRAAPAPGSRGSRHRFAAWPVASVAVAHVDTSMRCSTSDPGLANAAGTPCRRPHTAASPSPPLSAQGKSEQSAFGAARLQSGCAHVIPGPPHRGAHRPPYYGVIARRSKIKPVESDRVRWVHSREHPRVHSRERQGERAAQNQKQPRQPQAAQETRAGSGLHRDHARTACSGLLRRVVGVRGRRVGAAAGGVQRLTLAGYVVQTGGRSADGCRPRCPTTQIPLADARTAGSRPIRAAYQSE